MGNTTYRIKYRKGDFEIEVEGDKSFTEKKYKELMDLQQSTKTVQPINKSEKDVISSSDRQLSLREFIDQFNTTAHMDYILLIGYFLEKFRGQSSFTVSDINKAYNELREKISNAGPFITQNMRKGNLMVAPKKDGVKIATYSLTRKGIQIVENGLSLPNS